MIYLTSDTHFCHDREYIYQARGFSSIEKHDENIVKNWNSIVNPDDEVYLLGDVILMNTEYGLRYLQQLNGKIHIIRGNHDMDSRAKRYITLPNVVEVVYATMITYKNRDFYLSHYPTLVTNDIDKTPYKKNIRNLYGHTHQTNKFYNENPYMYCVCLDAHNNYPVSLEQIHEDIKAQIEKKEKEN